MSAKEPLKMVNVHEAKTHFSRLLVRVASGEEIVIARAGEPVARLVPMQPKRKERVLGTGIGKCWASDDCFDPLTGDDLAAWEDSRLFPDE